MASRLILGLALLCCVALARATPDNITGPEPNSTPEPAHVLAGGPLLAALRAGGYTLYFRHAATDFSKLDGKMKDYRDCANQRMLSDLGRRMQDEFIAVPPSWTVGRVMDYLSETADLPERFFERS